MNVHVVQQCLDLLTQFQIAITLWIIQESSAMRTIVWAISTGAISVNCYLLESCVPRWMKSFHLRKDFFIKWIFIFFHSSLLWPSMRLLFFCEQQQNLQMRLKWTRMEPHPHFDLSQKAEKRWNLTCCNPTQRLWHVKKISVFNCISCMARKQVRTNCNESLPAGNICLQQIT